MAQTERGKRSATRAAAEKPAPAAPTEPAELAEGVKITADAGAENTSPSGNPNGTTTRECTPMCVEGPRVLDGANPVPVEVTDMPPVSGRLDIALQRTRAERTEDQFLWIAIRNRGKAISFERYQKFIDRVLCEPPPDTDLEDRTAHPLRSSRRGSEEARLRSERDHLVKPFRGVDAYQLLKTATEVFLLLECGVVVENREVYIRAEETGRAENRPLAHLTLRDFTDPRGVSWKLREYLTGTMGAERLPYLDRILSAVGGLLATGKDSPFCDEDGAPAAAVFYPYSPCMLELLWSYWHEEGMLVQAINTVSLRFQNKRASEGRDPLAELEIDPLRPLANLLWGYIQDEINRLSIPRRAYEYEHQYGLTLLGKAVPKLRPADRRSKFLEAFHGLLHRASVFYQEDADTTVISDGFPLLNALREVHMILAEGAHNQFGDLPWTARVEMLVQQWLLARPEVRDFLRGRYMVPYKEGWMGQVDALKRLKGWTDTSITHFRDLGVFGEQIILSIRYGDWMDDDVGQDNAKNWARYWKQEIQSYLHAYRAATGVDLTHAEAVDFTAPAIHLRNRLALQARMA